MNDMMCQAAAVASTKAFQAKRAIRKQLEGQTLVEYVLIIALLSIVSIAVIVLCGDQIRDAFNKISSVLHKATGNVNTNPGNFVANNNLGPTTA